MENELLNENYNPVRHSEAIKIIYDAIHNFLIENKISADVYQETRLHLNDKAEFIPNIQMYDNKDKKTVVVIEVCAERTVPITLNKIKSIKLFYPYVECFIFNYEKSSWFDSTGKLNSHINYLGININKLTTIIL